MAGNSVGVLCGFGSIARYTPPLALAFQIQRRTNYNPAR